MKNRGYEVGCLIENSQPPCLPELESLEFLALVVASILAAVVYLSLLSLPEPFRAGSKGPINKIIEMIVAKTFKDSYFSKVF